MPSFASDMLAHRDLLQSRASSMRRDGILEEGQSLNGQLADVDALASGGELGAAASPAGTRGSLPAAPGRAMAELSRLPGARTVSSPEVDSETVQAFDQQGRRVDKADEQAVEQVIDQILAESVHTAAARTAMRHLLRLAARAKPAALAAMSGEARGLMMHLRDQVASRLDPEYPRRPTGFWSVDWDSSLNENVIATYFQRGIRVGPTFAKMPLPAQIAVMFHEDLHGFDDGEHGNGPGSTDGSRISGNRFSSDPAIGPDKGIPYLRNASERLAYADMWQWLAAL